MPRRMGGVTQGAQYFNGTTTRVGLANAMTLQDFTIMFWIKKDYAAPSTIVDFRDGVNDGVAIDTFSSTNINYNYNSSTKASSTLSNLTWTHYAISRESGAGTALFIKNGAQVDTGTIAGINATTTAGMIGRRSYNATSFYKGNLAQMAIFNTALSAATISGLMNKTYSQLSAGDKTNLVSWWALTNIVGTSVPDLHGTNTGTLTP